MKVLLLSALLVCGGAHAAGEGYVRELGVELWGGRIFPGMHDVRRAVDNDNDMVLTGDWEGGKDSRDLGSGLAGGVEFSYGILPDVRVVLAGETRGASWSAQYDGIGSNATVDVFGTVRRQEFEERLTFSSAGIEGGATFLLRRFEKGSRIGLAIRAGWHKLYGEVYRYAETGPLRNWEEWGRMTDVSTVGGMAGLEWEWLFRFGESASALGVYLLAGYRLLDFTGLDYSWRDDSGNAGSGKWEKPDGSAMSLDFSGPEVRFGLRYAFTLGE